MREVVLPSGRFATLRPITWWDKAICANASSDLLVLGLACRVVTIDGEPLTFQQAQEMELLDANPLIGLICDELIAGMKSKGIA